MREIQIGDQTIRLRGNTLSLYHYRKEFDRDLVGDLASMITGLVGIDILKKGKLESINLENINFATLDMILILRIVWVLARTAAGGPTAQFLNFDQWLEQHADIDLLDAGLLQSVMEEAKNCFFRGNKTVAPPAQR